MAHSNQIREFQLTSKGIVLADIYTGQGTVLTGSARLVQETQDAASSVLAKEETARRRRELEQAQRRIQAQIGDLTTQALFLEEELMRAARTEQTRADVSAAQQIKLVQSRKAD
jgi:circadian clock protein KaiC